MGARLSRRLLLNYPPVDVTANSTGRIAALNYRDEDRRAQQQNARSGSGGGGGGGGGGSSARPQQSSKAAKKAAKAKRQQQQQAESSTGSTQAAQSMASHNDDTASVATAGGIIAATPQHCAAGGAIATGDREQQAIAGPSSASAGCGGGGGGSRAPSPVTARVRYAKSSLYSRPVVKRSRRAAGYDVYASAQYKLPPGGSALCNIAVQFSIPEGYYGEFLTRTDTLSTRGVTVAPCMIDYECKEDVSLWLLNTCDQEILIHEGEPIAVLIIHRIQQSDIVEVAFLR